MGWGGVEANYNPHSHTSHMCTNARKYAHTHLHKHTNARTRACTHAAQCWIPSGRGAAAWSAREVWTVLQLDLQPPLIPDTVCVRVRVRVRVCVRVDARARACVCVRQCEQCRRDMPGTWRIAR